MRSLKGSALIELPTDDAVLRILFPPQQGEELIWWRECPSPQGRRDHSLECLEPLGRVGAKVYLCRLHAGVSEPQRDLADVPGRL